MQRVVVLGRGGAGKSTFARELGRITGLPAVELDEVFWSATLEPLGHAEWADAQAALVAGERWILDGDLGPYDVLDVRLARADTVVVLDYAFVRCAWRAVRRSREAADFWSWVWHYRRRSRPLVRQAVRRSAPGATVHWLTRPRQARRLLVSSRRTARAQPHDDDRPEDEREDGRAHGLPGPNVPQEEGLPACGTLPRWRSA